MSSDMGKYITRWLGSFKLEGALFGIDVLSYGYHLGGSCTPLPVANCKKYLFGEKVLCGHNDFVVLRFIYNDQWELELFNEAS